MRGVVGNHEVEGIRRGIRALDEKQATWRQIAAKRLKRLQRLGHVLERVDHGDEIVGSGRLEHVGDDQLAEAGDAAEPLFGAPVELKPE